MLTRRGLLFLGGRPLYAPPTIEGPQYPEETFNTPFWRRTALTILLGVAIYQAYPYLDEDGDYITRYLAYYQPDPRIWKIYETLGVYAAIRKANGQLLIESAQKSPIHRLRNPMSLDYASTRNVPVGSQVDVSKVQVKRSDTWA